MNTAQASIGDWSALYKVTTSPIVIFSLSIHVNYTHRLLTMLYILEKCAELYQMKSVSSIRCRHLFCDPYTMLASY